MDACMSAEECMHSRTIHESCSKGVAVVVCVLCLAILGIIMELTLVPDMIIPK